MKGGVNLAKKVEDLTVNLVTNKTTPNNEVKSWGGLLH